jgi:hypothetical protein
MFSTPAGTTDKSPQQEPPAGITDKSPWQRPPADITEKRPAAGRQNCYWVIARKANSILNCSAIRLQYFLVLILRTSRETTKLGFLKLGVLIIFFYK